MVVVYQHTATQEQDETEHREVEVKVKVQTDEQELVERQGECDRGSKRDIGEWRVRVCVCREQRRGRTREKERSHGMAPSMVQATTVPG